jgi:hypothetical protein
MADLMRLAEGWGKAEHYDVAGWDNASGNLERMITGYVAGDDATQVYAHAGELQVPRAPVRLPGWDRWVFSQRYLDERYRLDFGVSPPLPAPPPDEIVGVLHHYMQYSNRLPFATGKPDVAVAALEAHEGDLERMLPALLASALDAEE